MNDTFIIQITCASDYVWTDQSKSLSFLSLLCLNFFRISKYFICEFGVWPFAPVRNDTKNVEKTLNGNYVTQRPHHSMNISLFVAHCESPRQSNWLKLEMKNWKKKSLGASSFNLSSKWHKFRSIGAMWRASSKRRSFVNWKLQLEKKLIAFFALRSVDEIGGVDRKQEKKLKNRTKCRQFFFVFFFFYFSSAGSIQLFRLNCGDRRE